MFVYLFVAVFPISCSQRCVVVEYECTGGGVDITIANRDDCSRFIQCTFGRPTYWQCRRGYVFDFCRQRYECFNATDIQCVVQKERFFDPLQAEQEVTTTTTTTTTTMATTTSTTTTTTRYPIVVPGLFPGMLPSPPASFSPYNPFLYGPGLGMSSGGLGFNLNLNYNPLAGWGLNSNLAIETPWSTMLAPLLGLPMLPPMPLMGNGMVGPGMMGISGMPFPPMFRKKRSIYNGYYPMVRSNAVQVNACVPSEPWLDNSITTSPKINGTVA